MAEKIGASGKDREQIEKFIGVVNQRCAEMRKKYGERFERQINFNCLQQIKRVPFGPKPTQVEDHAITAKMASKWLRLVMIRYFPIGLLDGRTQRRLIKLMEVLFGKPVKAIIKREFLLNAFGDKLPWTQNAETIKKFGNWFIDLLLMLLRNTFYVTENSKNVTQFYHKWDWRMLTEKKMADLAKQRKVTKVEAPNPNEVTTNVRFLPAKNKLRMLMPYKRQIQSLMKVRIPLIFLLYILTHFRQGQALQIFMALSDDTRRNDKRPTDWQVD